MDARYVMRFGLLGLMVTLLATGCPSIQPENAITWGMKAATNQLTQTTPREWQAIAEKINQAVPESEIVLSDEEAAAVVDFVVANDFDSIQEIVQAVEDVQNDPNLINDFVIPDSVMDLFGEFDFEAAVDGFLSGA